MMEGITIVLPSLDPDEKLMQVVDGLLAEGFRDIVLVNDGSGPEHLVPFAEAAKHPEVTVLTHAVNQGKGRAMKTAFSWILSHRPDTLGVVTVDGDNQHRPEDVKKCAEAMLSAPEKLWLGVRDFDQEDVPPKSRAGNRTTRTILRIACGVKVTDSQTGLRAISASLLPMMTEIRGERYEYETEMLLAVHRAGIEIGEVTIATVYINENETSHYRPLRDSLRVLRMILKYVSSALLCFVLDLGLFTLLNFLLSGGMGESRRIFLATYGARICSSLVNYTLNRNVVFRDSGSVRGSMLRYYLLAAAQAAASYALVFLLSLLFWLSLAGQTPVKLAVDLLLSFVSYQIQLRWVFRGEK